MIARTGCPLKICAGCVFRKRRVAVIGNNPGCVNSVPVMGARPVKLQCGAVGKVV